MNQVTSDALGQPLLKLIAGVGSLLVEAHEITTVRSLKFPRNSFRLRFADGSTLKGRNFKSPRQARVAGLIHQTLNADFLPRLIAQGEDVSLEEWVAGRSLDAGPVEPAWITECGRILAIIHNTPAPSLHGIDYAPMDVAAWVERFRRNVAALVEAQLMSKSDFQRLQDLVLAHLPPPSAMGIVHRDLCPENIVRDAAGKLFLVDNAAMTVGLFQEDLARVWYRWPMTEPQRRLFADGYGEQRNRAACDTPSLFWRIIAITNSANFRLGASRAAAAAVLEKLEPAIALSTTNAAPDTLAPCLK